MLDSLRQVTLSWIPIMAWQELICQKGHEVDQGIEVEIERQLPGRPIFDLARVHSSGVRPNSDLLEAGLDR